MKVKCTNFDWKLPHLSLHPSLSVTESLLFNKIISLPHASQFLLLKKVSLFLNDVDIN